MIRNVDQYYAIEYDILTGSTEEDQIYEVNGGVPTFRTEHQLNVLLSKIEMPRHARVLDYGCAKSSTMQALLGRRADLAVHLFDVSNRYIPYWRAFASEDRWALNRPPSSWTMHFDLITSFFSLEHIVDPVETMIRMRTLLKANGVCYFIVPNFLTNVADMIVADHANHFTLPSILKLLEEADMRADVVDESSHRGAFVVIARGTAAQPRENTDAADAVRNAHEKAAEIADFWTNAAAKVRSFEQRTSEQHRIAIYGAGFYGSFIASCLHSPERIACFLDQNPFLRGKQLNGIPVLTPQELPPDVKSLLVGLNPTVARAIISDSPELVTRKLAYLYL